MPVKARSRAEALTADRWTVDGNGCWIWNGAVNSKGYGYFYAEGKSLRAHRAMYELTNGPLPPGEHVHHTCRVPACVNPEHLEAVTPAEHPRLHLGERTGEVCSRGHERTPENTYIRFYPKRNARLITCRVCDRERQRARYHAARAAA